MQEKTTQKSTKKDELSIFDRFSILYKIFKILIINGLRLWPNKN